MTHKGWCQKSRGPNTALWAQLLGPKRSSQAYTCEWIRTRLVLGNTAEPLPQFWLPRQPRYFSTPDCLRRPLTNPSGASHKWLPRSARVKRGRVTGLSPGLRGLQPCFSVRRAVPSLINEEQTPEAPKGSSSRTTPDSLQHAIPSVG